jgi:undecaprenyl pyrophosphate phosphatase UppP
MAVWWEFVQNLPPIAAFVSAVWLWRRQKRREATVCIVVGGAVGALLIRFSESTIHNVVEPLLVTATNIVVFSLGMLLFAAYLGTEGLAWSNWKTDVTLGWVMGVIIGISQALAAGDPIPHDALIIGVVLHSLAMALPIPLALISVRALVRNAGTLRAALLRSVLLATVVTVIIGLVDYTYLLLL